MHLRSSIRLPVAQACRRISLSVSCLGVFGLAGWMVAVAADAVEPLPAEKEAPGELPEPRTEYLGRTIAPTMHFSHAGWLVRERRDQEEDTRAMLRALKLTRGQKVCDFGCGNGYHTLQMAKLVGETGLVYAVDIQPEMLQMLKERASARSLENIRLVEATIADPKLPQSQLDLVLLVDVYHELTYPARILAAIRQSLAPGGRVVLVEFRAEDPEVPIRPLHKMTRQQVVLELKANGFELDESFDELPWQHMLFFRTQGKSSNAAAAIPSTEP